MGCCCFAYDDAEGEDNVVDGPNAKEKFTIVYRHYATLYFIFIVDDAESPLGILDLLQVFVQVLDTAFENVGELVMAGMVLETNLESILLAVQEARKLEQEEN